MFLKRGQPGQAFVIPGSLRAVADGSAVTSGATLIAVKDGKPAQAAGKLAHVAAGCYAFTPDANECDCSIFGWVLDAPGAMAVCGSLRVTRADPDNARGLGLTGPFPADVVSVDGQQVRMSDKPIDANAVLFGGQPVIATGPVAFPLEIPEAPPHFAELCIDADGCVRLQPGSVVPAPDPEPLVLPDGLRRLDVDEKGRVKVQPIGISLVGE